MCFKALKSTGLGQGCSGLMLSRHIAARTRSSPFPAPPSLPPECPPEPIPGAAAAATAPSPARDYASRRAPRERCGARRCRRLPRGTLGAVGAPLRHPRLLLWRPLRHRPPFGEGRSALLPRGRAKGASPPPPWPVVVSPWQRVMATAVNEFSGRQREKEGLSRLQLRAPDRRGLSFLAARAGAPRAAGGGGGSGVPPQAEPVLLLVPALRRLRPAPLRRLPARAALRLALRAPLPRRPHGRQGQQGRGRRRARARRGARDGAGLSQAGLRVHLHGAAHRRGRER